MTADAERLFDKKSPTVAVAGSNEQGLVDFLVGIFWASVDGAAELAGWSRQAVFDRLEAIGIAFAGPVDFAAGTILDAPNFNVEDLHLVKILRTELQKPVHLDNDVNLGFLGEAWKGVAKASRSAVGIIIGTGIGGGIAINGKLYRGMGSTAGEVGHMVLQADSGLECGCGQRGCFEVLASRKSIAREFSRRKRERGIRSLRWKEENLGSNELAHYYLAGDRDAIEAVDFAASMCGKAVFSLLNILNPDLVFFGGGFIKQIGEAFLDPVRAEASKCMRSIYRSDAGAVPIAIGVLDNPMLVGACRLALHEPPEEHAERTLIADIRAGLSPHQVQVLREVAEAESLVPISKDPNSDFYVEVLRPLRDAGLLRTDTGRSLGNSGSVRITALGRTVAAGPRAFGP